MSKYKHWKKCWKIPVSCYLNLSFGYGIDVDGIQEDVEEQTARPHQMCQVGLLEAY